MCCDAQAFVLRLALTPDELVQLCNKAKWLNHTGCLRDRDRDWDMDEWVIRFHVEPFTLHLYRDRG